MKHYWYFISTLPYFPFGAPPPFSIAEFDGLCGRFLAPSDLRLMNCSDFARRGDHLPDFGQSRFLTQFFAWERGTRNELVALRARDLKKDADAWKKDAPVDAECIKAALAVHDASDPLQAELTFEKERWDLVERLLSLSQFTFDFLLGYRMKLQIAARCKAFEYERGQQGFTDYYREIIDTAADVADSAMKAESQHD